MEAILEKFPLLSALTESEREAVTERLEWIQLEPGLALFREGDPADALWLLLEGEIELSATRYGAQGHVYPGATFGTLSLVTGGAREVSAQTCSQCTLLRLSRASFRNLRESAPASACRLLEEIVREAAAASRAALSELEDPERPGGSAASPGRR